MAEARGLIATDGLSRLSLRRLASRLGVTAPALYAHVIDKQDLLRAIAEMEFDALRRRFEAVEATNPLDRIRGYSRAYVAHARADRELFSVMFLFPPDLGGGDTALEPVQLPAATRAFTAATEAVVDALAEGSIVSDDPLLVSLTLWSGLHGVASTLQLGFELSPELESTLIDEVIDRLLRGYAA